MRQETGIAIRSDTDHWPVLSFGKLGAIRSHQQWQVCELRRLGAGHLENQDVLEAVSEVVLTADDVRSAQINVVGAGCQVISRHAVASQESEILDVRCRFRLVSENGITKANRGT